MMFLNIYILDLIIVILNFFLLEILIMTEISLVYAWDLYRESKG